MSTALVKSNPAALMTQASDVAGVCAEIVKRTAQQIQGRKYVRVEGWQSIAAAYGCVASSNGVERVKGGVRAIGELHRVSDGALIASAEGFVGEDEPTWYGGEAEVWDKDLRRKVKKVLPKRPDFAIQAMAQTRAISRVCRSAFAFVVVLIDANLSTTPAEEMSGVVHEADAIEDMQKEPDFASCPTLKACQTLWESIPDADKQKYKEAKDKRKAELQMSKETA